MLILSLNILFSEVNCLHFTCCHKKDKCLFAAFLNFIVLVDLSISVIQTRHYKSSALFIPFSVILTCDIRVCLTWTAEKDNITFKCKVSNLEWKVYFFNPENEEQGYCISPIPEHACYSSHNIITQDRQTNTTVLVIQRHVDNNLNGPWKCYHGTNRDAAIVNVTVLTKGNIPLSHVAKQK